MKWDHHKYLQRKRAILILCAPATDGDAEIARGSGQKQEEMAS